MIRFFRILKRIFSLLIFLCSRSIYVSRLQKKISDPQELERFTADQVQLWAQGILKRLNVKVETEGNIPDCGGFLLVSNHQGYLDIPVHGAICKNLCFTPNSGIRNWLLIGNMVQLSHPVWIDRTSPAKAKQTLTEFRRVLQNGRSLVIYPEGTTTNGSVPLLPFKSTAFEAVAETDIPIVPVLTEYQTESKGDIHPAWADDTPFLLHVFRFLGNKSVTVQIKVLDPCYADGRDRKKLAEDVRTILENARIQKHNQIKEQTT